MTCSGIYDPLRWLVRNPTLGHTVMHPRCGNARGLIELECADCLRRWLVRSPYAASDEYVRRLDEAVASHQHWRAESARSETT